MPKPSSVIVGGIRMSTMTRTGNSDSTALVTDGEVAPLKRTRRRVATQVRAVV
jgi:hypothetical protein